jgi:hypothetical protein
MRFPAHRFARCVRAPSNAYRAWLAAGLERAMTDWESHQRPPRPAALARAVPRAGREEHRWSLGGSKQSGRERALGSAMLHEMTGEEPAAVREAVPDGIKLNARSFLAETRCAAGTMRTLTVGGAVIAREFAPGRLA